MTTPAESPPGAKVLALGAPLTLADGRQVRLKYGMAALVVLEETFGSLNAAVESIVMLESGDAVTGGGFIKKLLQLISAGLAHEGITYETLLREDLLDFTQLREYGAAIGQAFAQALPDMDPPQAQEQPAPVTVGSPGPTGTTSAP